MYTHCHDTHNMCSCNGIALQPLQVELSYSQCSAAPVKMAYGCAVTINGKVYYGGGLCPDDLSDDSNEDTDNASNEHANNGNYGSNYYYYNYTIHVTSYNN